MSAIALLMGLLLLSYLGSLLVGGRSAARGLPSGAEYLGLGFAVGPHALGLVERPMIADFEPIIQIALGWLAFVVGLDFGRVEGRRVRPAAMALGVVSALITGVFATLAVLRVLAYAPVPGVEGTNVWLLAAGAGVVTAETTRLGAQWVAARLRARGPLSDLLVELGSADDFVPLAAAGAIFSLVPPTAVVFALPAWGWFGVSLVLGALLGTVTALLLRGAEGYAVWGALLGTLLLGVGTAARFGFCTIFVTFVMGIALAAVSKTRRILRRLVGATERAALLPMLLLAGARLDFRPVLETRALLAIVAFVLIARILGKFVSAQLVAAVHPIARPAGRGFGLVLLSSGPVSISCGFVFALRLPGNVGDTVLICAAASAVLGDLVSTFALRRLLVRVGEVPAASVPPEAAPQKSDEASA